MKEGFFPRPPRTGQGGILLLKTEDVPCAKSEEELREEVQRLNDARPGESIVLKRFMR